jgi:hypothetical protein
MDETAILKLIEVRTEIAILLIAGSCTADFGEGSWWKPYEKTSDSPRLNPQSIAPRAVHTMEIKYRVIFRGFKNGIAESTAREHLGKLFNLPTERVQAIFSERERAVKSGVRSHCFRSFARRQ